jgi:hypothetical protein
MYRTIRFISLATLLLAACTPVMTPVPATATVTVTVTPLPTLTSTVAPSATPEPTATPVPIIAISYPLVELPDGQVVIPGGPDEYLMALSGEGVNGAVLQVGEEAINATKMIEGEDGLPIVYFSVPRGSGNISVKLADGTVQVVAKPEIEPISAFIEPDKQAMINGDKVEVDNFLFASKMKYKRLSDGKIIDVVPPGPGDFFVSFHVTAVTMTGEELSNLGGNCVLIDIKNVQLQWKPAEVYYYGKVENKEKIAISFWLPKDAWNESYYLAIRGTDVIFRITQSTK